MRQTLDRIRHAILFEVIALVLVTPVGSLLFGVEMGSFGVVALLSTLIAMLWAYGYNLAFDHALLRLVGHARKSLAARIVHAILLEIGLLVVLVPLIAWSLTLSWGEALLMDVSLSGFYLVYGFVFNWAYDLIVPAPAR